jgi:hypothetical protein
MNFPISYPTKNELSSWHFKELSYKLIKEVTEVFSKVVFAVCVSLFRVNCSSHFTVLRCGYKFRSCMVHKFVCNLCNDVVSKSEYVS